MTTPIIQPLERKVSLGPVHQTREQEILGLVALLHDPSNSGFVKDISKEVNRMLRQDGLKLLKDYLDIAQEIGRDTYATETCARVKNAESLAKKVKRASVEDIEKLYRLTGKMYDDSMHLNFQVKDTCGLRMIFPTEAHLRAAQYMLFERFGVKEKDVKDYIRHPKPLTGYKAVHAVTEDGVELQLRTVFDHFKAERDKYPDKVKALYESRPEDKRDSPLIIF